MSTTTRRGAIRSSNRVATGSAAAYAGVIGLPDPGRGPFTGDGGLYAFAFRFNRIADAWLMARSPECRAFAVAEREAAATFRR